MSNLPNLLSCTRFLLIPVLLTLAWTGGARLFLVFLVFSLPRKSVADFLILCNVVCYAGYKLLLTPWEGRGLLRTGKSALRWRCQAAPQEDPVAAWLWHQSSPNYAMSNLPNLLSCTRFLLIPVLLTLAWTGRAGPFLVCLVIS